MTKLKFQMASFRMAFFSSFRAKISSFRVTGFVFSHGVILFFFVFSHGVFSSFRFVFFSHGVFYFVFSSFRVTSFRRKKTQWHKPATIHCRVRDSGERIPVILHLHRPSNAGKMSGFSLLDKNSSGRKT